ncbi:hypothetical protein DSL72_004138 [Monilinia vaccinii-corymbosi]|uniref:Uncharacterized protein n=1 Tax=Monilinia vaccinii-corymbosi TaxID=61207 RepID=A0A8A3NYI6_9HELO|nr:hypothetical protein DSL72_004138 [Monilinia vaccinii-corymbosi]
MVIPRGPPRFVYCRRFARRTYHPKFRECNPTKRKGGGGGSGVQAPDGDLERSGTGFAPPSSLPAMRLVLRRTPDKFSRTCLLERRFRIHPGVAMQNLPKDRCFEAQIFKHPDITVKGVDRMESPNHLITRWR